MEKKTVSNGKLFILEKPFNRKSKWVFAFYCVAFFALVSWYFTSVFHRLDLLSSLLFATIVTGYIIAGYRIANNASRMKTILVTSNTLEFNEQCWFYKRKRKYEIAKITGFRFIERPVLSPHPLAGINFDYLGFQTTQQVINELYGDNRIAFDYNGTTISFGKDLYSWDYEELYITIFPNTNYN